LGQEAELEVQRWLAFLTATPAQEIFFLFLYLRVPSFPVDLKALRVLVMLSSFFPVQLLPLHLNRSQLDFQSQVVKRE